MIFLDNVKNKKVGVLGLGKTGLSVVRALRKSGALVIAYDDFIKKSSEVDIIPYEKWDVDFVVVSPGIHLLWEKSHPAISWARRNFIRVVTDIDLFCLNQNKSIIAVTGTNGKSTTVWIIDEVLKLFGQDIVIGGNFGSPVLSLDDHENYVFELSSYELEGSQVLGFDISILLNITPDHLLRHAGMFGYAAAKQKIFANFKKNSLAILGADDDYCLKIFDFLKSINHPNVIKISGNFVPEGGIGWVGEELIDARTSETFNISNPELLGVHNKQNLAAAFAVCSNFGMSLKEFSNFVNKIHALEHRQEIVLKKNGVLYINDSKATNIDSTEQALKRFSNIFLILGGRPKEDNLKKLEDYFPKIKHIFLIGEIANKWKEILDHFNVSSSVVYTLDNAVFSAFKKAKTGDVVLLSPACASFDQFKSFEHRGNEFKRLVKEL